MLGMLIWSKYQRPSRSGDTFAPLEPVAEALEAGIGEAALVLVVVPLAIAVRIELRSARADRLHRERAKSSDREQQASWYRSLLAERVFRSAFIRVFSGKNLRGHSAQDTFRAAVLGATIVIVIPGAPVG
jgi:hypothetical protein